MKEIIKKKLLESIDFEMKGLEVASQSSQDLIKSGDLKSDGKYDTRGVEAAYLAGAQMRRVEELKLERQLIEGIPVHTYKKGREIAIGDLLELEHNGRVRKYYLSSTAGGSMLEVNKEVIVVISVFSPIGTQVIGLLCGDDFVIELSGGSREYRILNVY